MAAKRARRLALLEAHGEPNGTGTLCADCDAPRTILNTSVTWSDAAKTRLTFHYAVCDACRSAKLCQRLRDDPAAKLVQMGADAAARTRRPGYGGAPLAASECTELVVALLAQQGGKCASCTHEVTLAAHAGIFMASLDKVGDRYDGAAQVLCLGCQRLYNDLDADARCELTCALVEASAAPRPRRGAPRRVRALHRGQGGADGAARRGDRPTVARRARRAERRGGLPPAAALRPALRVRPPVPDSDPLDALSTPSFVPFEPPHVTE
jgi:hypothetical protein